MRTHNLLGCELSEAGSDSARKKDRAVDGPRGRYFCGRCGHVGHNARTCHEEPRTERHPAEFLAGVISDGRRARLDACGVRQPALWEQARALLAASMLGERP